jgi:cysteinyl-tRNA synthetase
MIEDLIAKGHAYVADNNDVFFSVRSYEEYGKLSNKVLDDLDPGSRISEDQAKADPLDFVLWKSAKPEEPSWDSPWGKGRPGWHIECSVMSLEKLGKNFDIHGGGPDLIFPHHENEIAQSKCSNDSEFANYWIHSGLLKIGGEKMSKSLGNFALIKDLIKQYHFEVIRLFLISSHYRSELSFDDGSLNQARAALERLYTTLQLNDEDVENTAKENPFIEAFEMAMNDDLNTPKAVSILFDLAKELNSNKDKNSRNEQLYAFKTIANNLGLLTDKPENFFKFGAEVDDLFIQEKIDARNLARNQKDFVRADEIRDELSDMGVLLDDGPDGTTWKIEKPN